jgi:hypothetical protein
VLLRTIECMVMYSFLKNATGLRTLVLAPLVSLSLAGWEHGQTIPLADRTVSADMAGLLRVGHMLG